MLSLRSVLLAAIAVCALVHAVPNDKYSRRYNVCKSSMPTLLNKTSGASKCTLISGMLSLYSKANFTVTQNTTFTAWVNSIETTIVNNASINSTNDKFQAIAAEFYNFQMNNSDIYAKVQYLNISTWGPMDTFVRVTNEYNFQSSLELVVATSAKGDCKLFDLLLSACTDVSKKAALTAFIQTNLKPIVAKKGMSQKAIIQAVFKAFNTQFFTGAQASWKQYFFGLKLKGFMAFSQWSSAAVSYTQQTSITETLSGDVNTCPFMLALNASRSASSNLTNAQKGQIVTLINYFTANWSTVITVQARMDMISMKFSESIDLSWANFALFGNIQISGFGSFWDLIIFGCQGSTMPSSCGCPVPTFTDEITTTEKMEPTTEKMMTTTEMPSTTMMPTTTMEMTPEMSTEAAATTTTMIPSTTSQCMCSCEMGM